MKYIVCCSMAVVNFLYCQDIALPETDMQSSAIKKIKDGFGIQKPAVKSVQDDKMRKCLLNVTQSDELAIDVNHSSIYRSKDPIEEVFIVNNKTVEVKTIDAKSFYIFGLSSGETEIYLSKKGDTESKRVTVRVMSPIARIQDEIKRSLPHAKVNITPLEKGIVLEGIIASTKDAQTIEQIAKFYLASDDILINNIQISQSVQVGLQVKIAEVTRGSLEKMNIDWSGTIRGSIAQKAINFNLNTTTTNAKNNVSYNSGPFNILAALDMLVEEKKASILAEPTLITLSGKTANFLAGGEIPYQSNSSTSTGGSSVEFKPYGIKLSFTPTVFGEKIHLTLDTEVSNVDKSLALKSNGADIPGLSKKQADTHIVLKNGQTLMIAGMLYSESATINSKFPGLGDIPLLGALFSSDQFDFSERELVIIVTPHLVSPVEAPKELKMPTDYIKHTSIYGTLFNKTSRNTIERKKFKAGFSY